MRRADRRRERGSGRHRLDRADPSGSGQDSDRQSKPADRIAGGAQYALARRRGRADHASRRTRPGQRTRSRKPSRRAREGRSSGQSRGTASAPPGARPGVLGTLPARPAQAPTVEAAPTPAPTPALAFAATPAQAPAPAAAAVAAAAAAKPPVRSGWIIQVGAYPAEEDAKQRLSTVQSKPPSWWPAPTPTLKRF